MMGRHKSARTANSYAVMATAVLPTDLVDLPPWGSIQRLGADLEENHDPRGQMLKRRRRLDELDMTDAERLGQFIERYHRRVPTTPLKATKVLLTESGARFDLLLGQALLPTQAGEIPADQFAHIHAHQNRYLHTMRQRGAPHGFTL